LPSSCFGATVSPVGLKQIIQNFSWETLWNLPPSEFLALTLMAFVALALVLGVLGAIASMLNQ
jgi:hypothetical protein